MRLAALSAVVLLLAGGCSGDVDLSFGGDPEGAAERLIAGDLEAQIGLGALQPSCDDPPDPFPVGESFDCTATTGDGATITLTATQDREDHLDVVTTNVVSPTGLQKLEASAAKVLGDNVGTPLPAENLDCGDRSLIVTVPQEIRCTLTEPGTGTRRGATLTLKNIDPGAFDIVVDS
jgi:hypothetical protein